MTETEELLVDGCSILKTGKEIMLLVMACCRTENQQWAMLNWMKNHYKENPSREVVEKVALLIREKVK